MMRRVVQRLASIPVERPRIAVAAWLSVVLAMVIAGAVLGGQPSPTSLVVPGNGADRAQQMDRAKFGAASTDVAVLLRGAPREVPSAARRLAQALRELPHTQLTVARPGRPPPTSSTKHSNAPAWSSAAPQPS